MSKAFLKVMQLLQCPRCFANLDLNVECSFLICEENVSHRFPILEGIPSFVRQEDISPEDAKWVFEYDKTAEQYDEAIKRYDEWLGVDLEEEFRGIIQRLPVKSSQLILDVSTGTGAVIFRMKEAFPTFTLKFVGTDLSMGMLRVAHRKIAKADMEVPLFHTHVNNIPFKDESFDIVTHMGGINTFKDISSALREWVRVLKPEGALLVADEGLSPTVRKTQRGLEIVESNRLFGLKPPLEHLPPQIKNIELRWFARGTFYAIRAQKFSSDEFKMLKSNGTEYSRIERLVEEYLEYFKAKNLS